MSTAGQMVARKERMSPDEIDFPLIQTGGQWPTGLFGQIDFGGYFLSGQSSNFVAYSRLEVITAFNSGEVHIYVCVCVCVLQTNRILFCSFSFFPLQACFSRIRLTNDIRAAHIRVWSDMASEKVRNEND